MSARLRAASSIRQPPVQGMSLGRRRRNAPGVPTCWSAAAGRWQRQHADTSFSTTPGRSRVLISDIDPGALNHYGNSNFATARNC
jgi:hypothetical protein